MSQISQSLLSVTNQITDITTEDFVPKNTAIGPADKLYFRRTARMPIATFTENADKSVTIVNAEVHNTAVASVPFIGYASRFYIEPDDSNELEVMCRITNLNLGTAGTSSGDSPMICMGSLTAGILLLAGIGRDGFTNPNPRNMVHQTASYDLNKTASTILKGADRVGSTYDLKFIYDFSSGIYATSMGYRTTWLSIDGGAYAAIPVASEENNHRRCWDRGVLIVLGYATNRCLTNFGAKIEYFMLLKGKAVSARY